MRALLIATGYQKEMEPILHNRPTPLLKIADKPIISHVIEYLVPCGIKEFDLILSHQPETVEELLGDGARWGISITYHLVRSGENPYATIGSVASHWGEEEVLIGRADSIPKLDLFDEKKEMVFFFDELREWTGWGIIPASKLANVPAVTAENDLPQLFHENKHEVIIDSFLSTRSLSELLMSNFRFISGPSSEHLFPTTAKMVEPSIWISRAVTLHPTAKINPPAFIGENCKIGPGVVIGPNAVIENQCIIDMGTHIEQSLICKGSYVGETLDIRNVIVNKNLLIDLTHGTNLFVQDDFILSGVDFPSIKFRLMGFVARCQGFLALLLFSPFYAIMRCQYPLAKKKVLCLPQPYKKGDWRTFDWFTFEGDDQNGAFFRFFRRLPALWNVVRGEAHLIGVRPLSIEEVEALSADWKKLYLCSKVGIINQSKLDCSEESSSDELYASEAFYAVQVGWLYDLKLLYRWFKRKVGFNA